jgi:hypothetical protein
VPADIAQAIVAAYGPDRNPDIALYSVYIGQDGFVYVKSAPPPEEISHGAACR